MINFFSRWFVRVALMSFVAFAPIAVQAAALNISPDSLPVMEVSASFSQTLTATNGIAPYTWSISGGALPPGLNLSAGGVLSGTPTSAGRFTVTIFASDSGSPIVFGDKTYIIDVDLAIYPQTSNLDRGRVGQSFSKLFTAVGSSGSYTWGRVLGAFPPGITLSSSEGILSGTPTTAGTYTFTVSVSGGSWQYGTRSYNLIIDPTVPPMFLSPATIANGTVGVSYSQTLTVSGGTGPYTTWISGGTPPPGITLSASGVLSGTPTTANTYNFSVQADDSAGHSTTKNYTTTISSAAVTISVSPSNIPNATAGTAYSITFSASGGTTPYTWQMYPGSTPPAGLSLSSSGVLSGTPTTAGSYEFALHVQDAAGHEQNPGYALTVNAIPVAPTTLTITPASWPDAAVSVAYTRILSATGGTTPYQWTFTSGVLPAGLSITSGGTFYGTPTVAGTYAFNLTVSDAAAHTDTRAFILVINPAPVAPPASSPPPTSPPPTSPPPSSSNPLIQNLNRLGIAVHALVKLPDDGNPLTQEDTAVYYIGSDGKRHAFPNSKVYFTWYANFDTVVVVSPSALASIPLGVNVTYKPGARMVKFQTDEHVYAVSRGGVLRWIKTEAVARSFYGVKWNQFIDDISDAFYTNYQFSAEINGVGDYNPSAEAAGVAYVSDSLRL